MAAVYDGRERRGPAMPPFDVEAEEAVLAAFALVYSAPGHTDGLVWCIENLRAEDFYREQNGWAFEALLRLSDRGEIVTATTLAEELDRTHAGQMPGGWAPWFRDILTRHFTAVGVQAHGRIVARNSLYRRMIAAAGQVTQLAYEGGPDPQRILAHAQALFNTMSTPVEPGPQLRALPL